MTIQRCVRRERAAAALWLAAFCHAPLHAQTIPPHEHLLLGRSTEPGTGGPAGGGWYEFDQTYAGTNAWLNAPRTFTPNTPGSAGAGQLYALFSTDALTYYDAGADQDFDVLQSCVFQATGVTPGLEIWKSTARLVAADPTVTVANNGIPHPYAGAWHLHLQARAFRPGVYTMAFKIAKGVAADGTALQDSDADPNTPGRQDYTVVFQSRAVLTVSAALTDWLQVDATPYKIGNAARVFFFPADSQPQKESDATATTDVYLDANGGFQAPEGVVPDGNYRIGVKPLTAPGVAKLLPGNTALSADAPPTASLTLPLGDANRDAAIDDADVNQVAQNQGRRPTDAGYLPDSDVNGDGLTDNKDFLLAVQNAGAVSDFTP